MVRRPADFEGTMGTELRLHIIDDDLDPESLERSTLQLRGELDSLDVDSVRQPVVDEAPGGTRSGTVAAVGALLVSLAPSAKLLLSVVQTVRSWLARSGIDRTVRLEVDGDVLELTGTSSQTQDRLVEEWIRLHTGAQNPP